jgi:uracil-DNA glycosylase family 4
MAEFSKKDSKPNEESLVPTDTFYYRLWKDRLDWTRHVIPVRAFDRSTGFFIECYASILPSPKDQVDQVVELKYQFLPTTIYNVIFVRTADIYPTGRNITLMGESDCTQVAFDKYKEFNPTKKIPVHKIDRLFINYRDCSFTIPEIESMLNNKLTDEYKELLVPSGEKKICPITSNLEDSYMDMEEKSLPETTVEDKKLEKVKDQLDALYLDYDKCTRCSLGKERSERGSYNITPSRIGHISASSCQRPTSRNVLFIIGEAPGVQEESSGITFNPNAPAGGILEKVLKVAGFSSKDCYFANSVLCRPTSKDKKTQNGKPSTEQIIACSSRLKNEIAIVNPSIILVLGKTAYRAFFGKDIPKVLGASGWKDSKESIYFAPHPSYVARELSFSDANTSPKVKKAYLNHFTLIKSRLDTFKEKKKNNEQ